MEGSNNANKSKETSTEVKNNSQKAIIAEASQKSSEEAEIIKESMSETTRTIEKVALTTHNQVEIVQKLNEIVQKFKL